MASALSTRHYSPRLSRAAEELLRRLESSARPVISTRDFAAAVIDLYRDGQGLLLRHLLPDRTDVKRLRVSLDRTHHVSPDSDYGSRALRLSRVADGAAEDICCLVDPSIYVSHLSAMQRYGLTERRPVDLLLTRPDPRPKTPVRLEGEAALLASLAPRTVSHPDRVRGRNVNVLQTAHPGSSQTLRGGFARISTIGQTFLDTLDEPALCGGMAHVLDVWRRHAATYLDMIVPAIDTAPKKLAKVRAGYILDEILGVSDSRVMAWRQFAQRGGSRLLDPEKPYAPIFSERWMLSLNAG